MVANSPEVHVCAVNNKQKECTLDERALHEVLKKGRIKGKECSKAKAIFFFSLLFRPLSVCCIRSTKLHAHME